MRLVHPALGAPITFEENKINVLVVENANLFVDMIMDLRKQIEGKPGDFILSRDFVPLQLGKETELIANPLYLDFSQKRIVNKIFLDLEHISAEEHFFTETYKIRALLSDYLAALLSQNEAVLDYDSEIAITALLKAANVHFDCGKMSIVEQIVEYLKMIHSLSLASCFIFINLKTFLSDEDMESIYKAIFYNKYNVLLLENSLRESMRGFEKTVLIDADLCEVINEN